MSQFLALVLALFVVGCVDAASSCPSGGSCNTGAEELEAEASTNLNLLQTGLSVESGRRSKQSQDHLRMQTSQAKTFHGSKAAFEGGPSTSALGASLTRWGLYSSGSLSTAWTDACLNGVTKGETNPTP